MRLLVVLLLAGLAASEDHTAQIADREFLVRQKDVLTLLTHVFSPFLDPAHQEMGKTFEPINHLTSFQKPVSVQKLVKMHTTGHSLPKGSIFCLFNEEHRKEMIYLFEALYFAKDWATLMQTARWARVHLNPMLFVYATKVALLHREDSQGIRLPPAYELNPHMFVTSDTIAQAYRAKMRNEDATVPIHFTGTMRNPEQHVAYFGEDVGLNSHHSHWHMDFPFWWKKDYPTQMDRKGEFFWYAHHQLTSRFDLERLSNGLDMAKPLSWREPIEDGFSPQTVYRTGDEFPARPDGMYFHDIENIIRIEDVEDMERRIRNTIDSGSVLAENRTFVPLEEDTGINTLGELIEASAHSLNPALYGSLHNLVHIMLGQLTDPENKYDMPPGVMEHFETATRDPVFFRLHKYIDNIFKSHKDLLPPYTKEQLSVPGLKLSQVEVDELVTYFEDFQIDLAQGLEVTGTGDAADIKGVMARISHKPFTYKVTIQSDCRRTSVVRVFLAPKYDFFGQEIPISENRWQTVELDKFPVELKSGSNVVTRSSTDSSVTIPDPLSHDQLLAAVDSAINRGQPLYMDKHHRQCGIPDRMLLPKGKASGMPFLLFVVVNDMGEVDATHLGPKKEFGGSLSLCGAKGFLYPDSKPLGFPFDRPIKSKEDFITPNMLVKDVVITHVPHA